MSKLTRNVFGLIMLSIFLFIVVSLVNYVTSANAMRHKVYSVMDSLCDTVMKNNYLNETSADMYNSLLQQIKTDDPRFVASIEMNYGQKAEDVENFTIPSSIDNDGKDLRKVSNYGDKKVIQIHVRVKRIVWGSETGEAINDATDFSNGWSYKDFYYSEIVPCDRYIK